MGLGQHHARSVGRVVINPEQELTKIVINSKRESASKAFTFALGGSKKQEHVSENYAARQRSKQVRLRIIRVPGQLRFTWAAGLVPHHKGPAKPRTRRARRGDFGFHYQRPGPSYVCALPELGEHVRPRHTINSRQ